MKNMRKFVAVLLAVVMAVSIMTVAMGTADADGEDTKEERRQEHDRDRDRDHDHDHGRDRDDKRDNDKDKDDRRDNDKPREKPEDKPDRKPKEPPAEEGEKNNDDKKAAKRVSVARKNGSMQAGVGGTVNYTVTTTGIANGSHRVSVSNLPRGVSAPSTITIANGSGELALRGNTRISEGTRNNLTLRIDGITSSGFALAIAAKNAPPAEVKTDVEKPPEEQKKAVIKAPGSDIPGAEETEGTADVMVVEALASTTASRTVSPQRGSATQTDGGTVTFQVTTQNMAGRPISVGNPSPVPTGGGVVASVGTTIPGNGIAIVTVAVSAGTPARNYSIPLNFAQNSNLNTNITVTVSGTTLQNVTSRTISVARPVANGDTARSINPAQFSGTLSWDGVSGSKFPATLADTYTATINIFPKPGYAFLNQDAFRVTGARVIDAIYNVAPPAATSVTITALFEAAQYVTILSPTREIPAGTATNFNYTVRVGSAISPGSYLITVNNIRGGVTVRNANNTIVLERKANGNIEGPLQLRGNNSSVVDIDNMSLTLSPLTGGGTVGTTSNTFTVKFVGSGGTVDAGTKSVSDVSHRFTGSGGDWNRLTTFELNTTTLSLSSANSRGERFISGWPGFSGNIGVATQGSINVRLYSSFIRTLPNGEYTLRVWYGGTGGVEWSQGGTHTFRITNSQVTTNNPRTYDSNDMLLWTFVWIISLSGIVITITYLKYQKKHARI